MLLGIFRLKCNVVGKRFCYRCKTVNMESEVEKAQKAVGSTGTTIFHKILRKEIPANILHEDDQCMAIKDANPQSPVHFLVIPKKDCPNLDCCTSDDEKLLGHLLITAKNVAEKMKLKRGYRIVINNGPDGAQSVLQLHIHVLGGRQMTWPPG